MVDNMAYERKINACRITAPLAATANEPFLVPFKGIRRGRVRFGVKMGLKRYFDFLMSAINSINTLEYFFSVKKYQKNCPCKISGRSALSVLGKIFQLGRNVLRHEKSLHPRLSSLH
jgi:hypothetical protein